MPSRTPARLALSAALLLTAARCLTGCTQAQGRAAVPVLLSVGEALCEAFVPLVVPGFGALDVLACRGAEAGLAAILGAALPTAGAGAPSPLGGGGVAPGEPEPWRPLRVAGKVVGMVRANAATVGRAQKALDGRAGK